MWLITIVRKYFDDKPRSTFVFLLGIIWTISIISIFYFDYEYHHSISENIIISKAHGYYQREILYRTVFSRYGGVYMPLDSISRDFPAIINDLDSSKVLYSNHGNKLVLVSPSKIEKIIKPRNSKVDDIHLEIKGLITSDSNSYFDKWERTAFKKIQRFNKQFFSEFFDNGKLKKLRYFGPVYSIEGCLNCPPSSDYKNNKLIGGISISVSFNNLGFYEFLISNAFHTLVFLTVWMFGILFLLWLGNSIYKKNRQKILNDSVVRKSEETFRKLFNNMVESIVIVHPLVKNNQKYYSISKYNLIFEKCVGLSSDEIFSKDFVSVFDGDHKYWERLINKVVTESEIISEEKYIEKYKKYFEIVLTKIDNENIAIILNDITHRKQSEKLLIESNRFFEQALDMFAISNLDGEFLLSNPAWQRTLGWTSDELIGKTIFDFTHNDDINILRNNLKHSTNSNVLKLFLIRCQHKDGTYHWLEWSSYIYSDEKVIFSVARDITDKKLADDKVIKNETIMRAFIENAPFEIWARDKNDVGILENKKSLNHFGSIVGKTPEQSHLPYDVIQTWLDSNRRVRAGEVINEEVIYNVDGVERIFDTILAPIIINGEYHGIAGFNIDISDKKYQEKIHEVQFEITKAIAQKENLDEVFCIVENELSRIFKIDTFMISVYDTESDTFTPYNCFKKEENKNFFETEIFLLNQIIRNQNTTLLDKERISEIFFNKNLKEEIPIPEFWIGVPLLSGDKVIGVISISSNSNPDIFDFKGIEIIENIAYQLSTYIERVYAKTELKNSLQKLQVIVRNLPVVLFAVDQNAVFTISDGLGLQLLNLKPGQVVGLSVFDVYKDFPDILYNIQKGLEGESRLFVAKIGDAFFDTWLSPVFGFNGDVESLIGVAFDSTEKEKSKKELELSHSSYKGIFDNISELIYIQGPDGKFIEVNDKVCRIFGYEKSEIVGNVPSFLGDPELNDYNLINKMFDESINGKPHKFEFWSKKKNGDLFPQEVVFNAGNYFGKKVVVAVGRDISDWKEAEDELRAARDKAEESDLLKTRFLANMSHEIRTPMNAILGFSHLLEDDNLQPSEKKEYVSLIHRRGHDLLNIINDILDISKIEANQIKIYNEPCDVNLMIEELITIHSLNTKSKNIELKIGSKIETIPPITIDVQRLQQILNNLIGNSVKFTKYGYIEVGYKLIDNSYLRFYVKDTGVGIAKEKQEMIFERFRQSEDNHLTRIYDGAGLGLTICKGLLELMGGKIWVESEIGIGSTFYFTIPFVKSDIILDKTDTKKVDFNWSNKKILLVEDDDLNINLIRKVLISTNVEIMAAENGFASLDIIRNTINIDLVLLDIQLPDISGYELAKLFKKINPEIKIIAQTANAYSEDRQKALDYGCNDYIVKPIDRTELLKIISKYI